MTLRTQPYPTLNRPRCTLEIRNDSPRRLLFTPVTKSTTPTKRGGCHRRDSNPPPTLERSLPSNWTLQRHLSTYRYHSNQRQLRAWFVWVPAPRARRFFRFRPWETGHVRAPSLAPHLPKSMQDPTRVDKGSSCCPLLIIRTEMTFKLTSSLSMGKTNVL